MKIQIMSDLHLEFRDPMWFSNDDADVLILGGDIFVADYFRRNPRRGLVADKNVNDLNEVMITPQGYAKDVEKWRMFLKHCSDNWKNVIYLMGNHEHYKGRWERTGNIMREEIQHYPNIHFLDKDKIVIDGITFLGASLWTDMKRGDPLVMASAKEFMNDYKAIGHLTDDCQWRKLQPKVTYLENIQTVAWLKNRVKEDGEYVICTHHAPSWQSIHENYIREPISNYYFTNNLDDLIFDNPKIKLWTHGHVHNSWDYKIGETRVICNPLGYPGERTGFDPNLVVEI